MNKLFIILLIIFLNIGLNAQVPKGINYQAVIRDIYGTVITNSTVNMKFDVYNSITSTNASYSETQSLTIGNTGIATCTIGSGSTVSGSFSAINWQGGDVAFEAFVDFGSGFTIIGPRQKFFTVPYAFYADKAGSAPSPTISFNNNILSVGGNTTVINNTATYVAGSGISINSGTITNIAPFVQPTITGSGLAVVSPTAGTNFTITVPTQTLGLNNGTILNVGPTTNTINLAGLVGPWQRTSIAPYDISLNTNTDNVNIGLPSGIYANEKFHVHNTLNNTFIQLSTTSTSGKVGLVFGESNNWNKGRLIFDNSSNSLQYQILGKQLLYIDGNLKSLHVGKIPVNNVFNTRTSLTIYDSIRLSDKRAALRIINTANLQGTDLPVTSIYLGNGSDKGMNLAFYQGAIFKRFLITNSNLDTTYHAFNSGGKFFPGSEGGLDMAYIQGGQVDTSRLIISAAAKGSLLMTTTLGDIGIVNTGIGNTSLSVANGNVETTSGNGNILTKAVNGSIYLSAPNEKIRLQGYTQMGDTNSIYYPALKVIELLGAVPTNSSSPASVIDLGSYISTSDKIVSVQLFVSDGTKSYPPFYNNTSLPASAGHEYYYELDAISPKIYITVSSSNGFLMYGKQFRALITVKK